MKKTTIILLIITTIIITGIYTVYNIYIRLEKKKQSSTDIKQKEKAGGDEIGKADQESRPVRMPESHRRSHPPVELLPVQLGIFRLFSV